MWRGELEKLLDAGYFITMSKRQQGFIVSVLFFKNGSNNMIKFVGSAPTLEEAWTRCKRELIKGMDLNEQRRF